MKLKVFILSDKEYMTCETTKLLFQELGIARIEADGQVHINNMMREYELDYYKKHNETPTIRLDITHGQNFHIAHYIRNNDSSGNRFIVQHKFILYKKEFVKEVVEVKSKIFPANYQRVNIPFAVTYPPSGPFLQMGAFKKENNVEVGQERKESVPMSNYFSEFLTTGVLQNLGIDPMQFRLALFEYDKFKREKRKLNVKTR